MYTCSSEYDLIICKKQRKYTYRGLSLVVWTWTTCGMLNLLWYESIFAASSAIPVRLAGYGRDDEGRVEVFRHGTWGAVQAYSLRDEEAIMFCKMLGYP